MYIFLLISLVVISMLLTVLILMQNPKSAGFGSMADKMMGARRAPVFATKATWILVLAFLGVSLVSTLFLPGLAA